MLYPEVANGILGIDLERMCEVGGKEGGPTLTAEVFL
jgi:hypothetical protein